MKPIETCGRIRIEAILGLSTKKSWLLVPAPIITRLTVSALIFDTISKAGRGIIVLMTLNAKDTQEKKKGKRFKELVNGIAYKPQNIATILCTVVSATNRKRISYCAIRR